MAIRFTHSVRPAIVVAAMVAGAAVVPAVAYAAPSTHESPAEKPAKPTIESVEKQLGHLALQSTQLVEQYNEARTTVGKRDQAAAVARQQAAQAEGRYQAATAEFAQNAQAQYQAGGLGAAGALLDSDSGPNYVDRLNTLDMMSTYDAEVVSLMQTTKRAATTQAQHAADLLAAAKQERDAVAAKRDAVSAQIDKQKQLLGKLNAQQRAAFARAADGKTIDVSKIKDLPGGTSAAAKKAVNFAIDQVGKPYVFGAGGPSSFDCSGLTSAAWRAGGVSLPHSAAGQYGYGKHVDLQHLSPGDLIFMYKPISHVTIYIGGQMMVSAPTTGQNVKVVPVSHSASDIVGATHLG